MSNASCVMLLAGVENREAPHSAGEKLLARCSPRLRGAPVISRRSASSRRITPAPAGSTTISGQKGRIGSDHPRACGEHPGCAARSCLSLRITPAPAGSTKPQPEDGLGKEDHPRACGEHSSNNARRPGSLGSPPRLRGAHTRTLGVATRRRITPAPAGSTFQFLPRVPPAPDHPRACGEHLPAVHSRVVGAGSPPRLRGAQIVRRHTVRQQRITPAPAGSTGRWWRRRW
jgi:hypothetical protein